MSAITKTWTERFGTMWATCFTLLALFLFATPASAQTTVVFEPGVEGQMWKILSVNGGPGCPVAQRAPDTDGIWQQGRCDPNFGATITFTPNTLSYPMQLATDQPTTYLSNARAILPTPAALTPQDIINGNSLNTTTGLVACTNPLNIVNYVTDDYRLQAFDYCTNPVKFGVAMGAELAASTVVTPTGPFAQPGIVVYQHPSGTMTANGSIVGANGQFINNAEGVKVDAAHNIIITDRENARVLVFDQNGAFLNSWSVLPAATALGIPAVPLLPTGVSMTPGTVLGTAGSGYVAVLLGGAGASRLLIYDALGTFVTSNATAEVCRGDFNSPLADGLCNPTDAWFDANGNLFVADIYNSRIAVYSFNTTTQALAFQYQFGGSADSTGAVMAPRDIAYPYSVALMQTVSGQLPRILVGDAGRQQMSVYQLGAPAPTGLLAGSQLVGLQLTNAALTQKVAGTTTATLPDIYYLFYLNAKGDLDGNPRGVMQDKAGRLYAADTTNHLVRRWELPQLAVVQLSTSTGNTVTPTNTIAAGGTFTSTVDSGSGFFVNGFGAVPVGKQAVINVTPSIWAVDRLDAQGNPLGTDGLPLIVGGQVDLTRLAVSTLVTPTTTGSTPLPTGTKVYPSIAGGTTGLYYWNFTAASGITTPTPVVFIIGAVGDNGVTIAEVKTIAITIVCGASCGRSTPVTTPVINSTYWSLNGVAQSGTANNSAAWHSSPATVTFSSTDTLVSGTPRLGIASVRFRSTGVTPSSLLGLPVCNEQYDPNFTWYCYEVPVAQQLTTVAVPTPVTLYADGATTIYYRAANVNGTLEAEKSVVVLVDAVPPTVAFTPTTAPNNFGWYRTNVTVNWRAADSESGPGGTTLPTWNPANTLTPATGALPAYTNEGMGITQVVNSADLVRNTSVWPYAVNIDKTNPIIAAVTAINRQSDTPLTLTLPFISLGNIACPGGTLTPGTICDPTPTAAAGPGPQSFIYTVAVSANNAVTLTQDAAGYTGTFPLGTTTVTVTATDFAGNSSTSTTTVTIAPTGGIVVPPKVTVQSGSCDCNLSGILWPPNHKLVTITAKFDGFDPLTSTIKLLSIVSNEPEAANGDQSGHHEGDYCDHERRYNGHKDGDGCTHDKVLQGHHRGDGDDHDKGVNGHYYGDGCDHDKTTRKHYKGDGDAHDSYWSWWYGHYNGDACSHDLDVNGHRAGDGDDHDRGRNGHYDGDGCDHDAWAGLDIQTMTGKPISTVYGTDTRMFQLRAERFATGTGRTYTITYQVTNQYGSSTTVTATAFVPKDLSTVTLTPCPKAHHEGDGDDHDRGKNGHKNGDNCEHDRQSKGHHQGDGDDHDLKKNGHKDGDGCSHDVSMKGHRKGDGDDHEKGLNGHHAGDNCEHEKAMNRHFRGDGDDHDKGLKGHSKGDGCSHDIDLGGHHTNDNCEHERHANGHHSGDGCDHDDMDRDNDEGGKGGWFGASCKLGSGGGSGSGSGSDDNEHHSKGDNCDHERGTSGHHQGDGCEHEKHSHSKGDKCDHERGLNGHHSGDGCEHEKQGKIDDANNRTRKSSKKR